MTVQTDPRTCCMTVRTRRLRSRSADPTTVPILQRNPHKTYVLNLTFGKVGTRHTLFLEYEAGRQETGMMTHQKNCSYCVHVLCCPDIL